MTNQEPRRRSWPANCFQPWPLSLLAFCSFIALAWFSTACLNFDGTNYWTSRTTAGWFVCGFPFTAGIGLLYAAFVAFLARRIRRFAAWIVLAIGAALLADAIHASTPEMRLARIVGARAARSTPLDRLKIVDSFNEGETAAGIFTDPDDLLEMIAQDRTLELTRRAVPDLRLHDYFPELFPQLNSSIPQNACVEIGDMASNERSIFYRQPATRKIYFLAR